MLLGAFHATDLRLAVVYDVRLTKHRDIHNDSIRRNVSDPIEHRPVLPLADRARTARSHWVSAALRLLQGSAEDSGEALHADDHGVHRHGRIADDHSAAAVLCEGVERVWLDC